MTVKVGLNGTAVLALAALGVVGLIAWKGIPKLAEAAGAAANAVNPLNHDNVFAQGVNAAGGAIVSDPAGPGKNADGSWSLGGWLYDVTHPATAGAVAGLSAPLAWPSSGLSAAQAADARTLYAAQDPRRFDMQPEGNW